jgi:hypothetical protein
MQSSLGGNSTSNWLDLTRTLHRDAQIWLREILASDEETSSLLGRIAVSAVGPYNVVAMLGKLSKEGKLPYRAIGIVDGDHPDGNCSALPGALAPERVVYADLKAQGWPNLEQRFGIGAGELFTYLEDAMLEPDHHDWNARVGDKILKSATSVWEVLANEWSKRCLDKGDRQRLFDDIVAAAKG